MPQERHGNMLNLRGYPELGIYPPIKSLNCWKGFLAATFADLEAKARQVANAFANASFAVMTVLDLSKIFAGMTILDFSKIQNHGEPLRESAGPCHGSGVVVS
jgi:hypothetical protein